MKQHFMDVKTCEFKSFVPTEGITTAIEKQLRSRKKGHASQTQEDRWKDIYRILFPMEPVPDPCEFYFSLQRHSIANVESSLRLTVKCIILKVSLDPYYLHRF